MIRIGTVWERTTEVIAGRGRMLAGIALLTGLLPALVGDALRLAVPSRGVGAIATIAVAVIGLWGSLAMIAVSTDPAIDRADGYRMASRALPAAVGVAVLLLLAVAILSVPLAILLVRAGFDVASATAGATQRLDSAHFPGILLYSLVLFAALVWAGARLALIYPVLVVERAGVGAIGRSVRLTRGLAAKIVGVLILYAIVLLVAMAAAKSVAGIVFGLALGSRSAAALLLTAAAVALVSAAFAVFQSVFTAQLYVAARDREAQPA